MENVTLSEIKANVCSKCNVLARYLGTEAYSYRAGNYARYERCKRDSDHSRTMFDYLDIDLEKNVFHRLHSVSAPSLHKPDLLYTVYLG